MGQWDRGRAMRRALVAALMVGVLTGCGNDMTMFTGQGPTYDPGGTYDCCADDVYYVCQTKLAYGQCYGIPHDPSSCTLQVGRDCPPTANQ